MGPPHFRQRLHPSLTRALRLLAALLRRQRERGRSPAADAVRGVVIEEGEAEGLVGELAADWGPDAPPARPREVGPPDDGPGAGFDPFRHAARAFDLLPAEGDALLLAVAVEMDARFGRLVAFLNDHVGHTRPTVGLALAVAALGGEVPAPVEFCDRPMVRDGLLELEGDGPLPGLALRLPTDVLRRMTAPGLLGPGEPGLSLHPPDPTLPGRLVLDAPARGRLEAWAEALRGGRQTRPLLLSGVPGSGRATAARAAAALAGLPLVGVKDAEGLRAGRRDARWYEAALLVRAGAGTDWSGLWANAASLRYPPLVTAPPGDADEAAASAPHEPVLLCLGEPGRLGGRLWRTLLPPGEPVADEELNDLAGRFRFSPGRIARAIRRAGDGAVRLTADRLAAACREVGSALMGPLAQKMPLPYARADLVVPDLVGAELDLAVAWVRHRHRVLDEWGFAGRVAIGRGLTALFAGPPGTGKTMAAQVLARELGVDLYRVDLSRVMSKYIGETEKALGRLFDEAQASGAALFFDEADALFGKRSEVKDAHDRYANVEVGYLLQRMEEHEGVTVLATNRARDLDEAFVRRFHVIADFPLPGENERLRIWKGMIPPLARLAPDVDLPRLAREVEFSGGEIKNVALAAAFLAAADGRPIRLDHLRLAIAREFRKSGRLLDDRALGPK